MKNHMKYRIRMLTTILKQYPIVFSIGNGAVLFSVFCLIFKCNPHLNVPMEWMRILGDFLLNIATSIIAAEIFFIFQVIIPEGNRDNLMRLLMYNNIVDYTIVPLRNLRMEISLLDGLSKLSNVTESLEIPDSIKKKPREEVESVMKTHMQSIKKNIESNIKMYHEFMPDGLQELLEQIKNSPLMERVVSDGLFSDINQNYEDINPLINRLEQFISDDDIAYRNRILSASTMSKTVRNNIETIAETIKLYSDYLEK